MIIFQQVTEKICVNFCKLDLPRLWVRSSQVSHDFGVATYRAEKYFMVQPSWAVAGNPNSTKIKEKKNCKQEMLCFFGSLNSLWTLEME